MTELPRFRLTRRADLPAMPEITAERRGNEAWDAWCTMEKERPLKVVTAGKVS